MSAIIGVMPEDFVFVFKLRCILLSHQVLDRKDIGVRVRDCSGGQSQLVDSHELVLKRTREKSPGGTRGQVLVADT